MNMHKDGSLAELLAEKKVIIEADDADFETEQSTGGTSKEAKGGRS